jgi:hypothetical protein
VRPDIWPASAAKGEYALRGDAPAAPRTIHDSGLSFAFLIELVAKHLFHGGQLRLIDLVRLMRLPPGILEPVLGFLRAERLSEVVQRASAHADVSYMLTELGRNRAEDFLRHSEYAGPAPVSHQAYSEQVGRQSVLESPIGRERMVEAFADCVIGEDMIDRLGVAMNSGRPIFLHGPAGSGKSFAGARLVRVFAGPVFVPHAVAVGNEIVEVFDPLVHHPVADPEAPFHRGLDRHDRHDERWVLCHRPAVIYAGELAPAMLNLEFDEGRRVHILPAHLKANNGVLVIDDLGRQLVQVQDLLNRWILPLDSRADYMALRSGRRFRVPVDVKVIFCTNLHPSRIGDEAFLRRLGHKVHVGEIGITEYAAIFQATCREFQIPFDTGMFERLLWRHQQERRPLLASVPRELLEPVRDFAHYRGTEPQLTETLLDWAWENRFAPEPAGADRSTEELQKG